MNKKVLAILALAPLAALASPAIAQNFYSENFDSYVGSSTPYVFGSDLVGLYRPSAGPATGCPDLLNPTNLWCEGAYAVDTNPGLWHSLWTFGPNADHTVGVAGSGQMMIINGHTGGVCPDVKTFESPVFAVVPNRNYSISYWIALTYNVGKPIIELAVNGVSLDAPFNTEFMTEGTWNQVTATWNSGSATTAQISLCDQIADATGNDYALDDISVNMGYNGQWCSPGYWRQPQHAGSWPPTGYSPTQPYSPLVGPNPTVNRKASACLSVPSAPTLWDVLSYPQCYGGAAFNAVADLLSGASPYIDFMGVRVENSCPLN